jgi:hypothetical protein
MKSAEKNWFNYTQNEKEHRKNRIVMRLLKMRIVRKRITKSVV